MGKKTGRAFFIALLVALIVVGVAYWYITGQRAAAPPVMTAEVVAAQDIPAGSILTPQLLTTRQVPQQYMGPGAITNPNLAVGKLLRIPLVQGEAVRTNFLATKQQLGPAGFAFQIPKGMRAMTVPVDVESGLAGMLQPGDRLDAMALFPPNVNGQTEAKIFMDKLLILMTGTQQAVPSGTQAAAAASYSTITLAVTPQQATTLAMAEKTGTIQFLLRPAKAKHSDVGVVATLANLKK